MCNEKMDGCLRERMEKWIDVQRRKLKWMCVWERERANAVCTMKNWMSVWEREREIEREREQMKKEEENVNWETRNG